MDKAFLSGPQTITMDSKQGGQLTLRVIPEYNDATEALIYGGLAFQLFHVEVPGYEAPKMELLGRLLFDREENWVYDGDKLTIDEQEEAAGFITGHRGAMDRLIKDIL
ncbi:MAG: hypothetical protein ABI166_10140 [Mucilaginibacter sp.]